MQIPLNLLLISILDEGTIERQIQHIQTVIHIGCGDREDEELMVENERRTILGDCQPLNLESAILV